jgi:beta-mannosidase
LNRVHALGPEEWQLALAAPGAPVPDHDWIAAPVPGTAAEALQAAGRWTIARPTPLHDKDIWYRTRFAGTGRRTLRFEGLATIAEVWLNGAKILDSDNMFLAHDVEVDLAGDNTLLIAFRSLDKALEGRKGRARWRTKLVENNALRLVRTTLLGHMTGWQPPVDAVGPVAADPVRHRSTGCRPLRHARRRRRRVCRSRCAPRAPRRSSSAIIACP